MGAGGQGAGASVQGGAGVSGGQVEGELAASRGHDGEHGQGGGGGDHVQADVQGQGLSDGNVAGGAGALADREARGSGLARAQGDVDGGSGGHEGGDEDQLEHGAGGACWLRESQTKLRFWDPTVGIYRAGPEIMRVLSPR